MRKILSLIIGALLVTVAVKAQNKFEVHYKNGMNRFERDVAVQMFKYLDQIPHDYLLFFEISLNKKGVRSVNEIYSTPDSISNAVYKAIKDISPNWTSKTRRLKNVIIPIFLRKDLETSKIDFTSLSFNSGSTGYPNIRELKRCFITPPIVFTSSEPIR